MLPRSATSSLRFIEKTSIDRPRRRRLVAPAWLDLAMVAIDVDSTGAWRTKTHRLHAHAPVLHGRTDALGAWSLRLPLETATQVEMPVDVPRLGTLPATVLSGHASIGPPSARQPPPALSWQLTIAQHAHGMLLRLFLELTAPEVGASALQLDHVSLATLDLSSLTGRPSALPAEDGGLRVHGHRRRLSLRYAFSCLANVANLARYPFLPYVAPHFSHISHFNLCF